MNCGICEKALKRFTSPQNFAAKVQKQQSYASETVKMIIVGKFRGP